MLLQPRPSLSLPPGRSSRRFRLAGSVLLAALASTAQAVDFYKADNLLSLTNASSWWLDAAGTTPVPVTTPSSAPTNNTAPTSVGIWNNLVTTSQLLSIPDVGLHTIRILNPGGPITLDGTSSPRTVTAGNGGGIDMTLATQDLTLQNLFYRIAGSGQIVGLQVAAGRTLTFGTAAQVNVRSNASNATLNINTDGTSTGTVTFAANIAPSHVVVGAGHVEFNSLSGSTRLSTNTTTIGGGTNHATLLVNNTSGSATGSGAVAVNSNATLGGTGIITGVVSANAGSILSPGVNGVGTLTLGSLTLATDSSLVWEATNTVDADRVAVTAADGLVINGGVIHLHNPGTTDPFTGTGLYTLISHAGAIGGAGISALSIAEATKIEGRTYTIGIGAGSVTLRITSGSVTPIHWNTDASGNWSTGANWTGGVAPGAIGAIAQITGAGGATLTAPRTVTLDSPHTVGQLILDSTQSVTLAGASALTLDDGGAAATLNALGASHSVSAPLSLTTGGVITTVEGAGNTLTLAGAVSGTDVGVVKVGDGTLLLTADNPYTGATSVSGGILQIGDGGSTGSVGGPISNSATLRFNRSNSSTLAFPIGGTGNVEFLGSGETTLAAANTFSGDTTLAAGTLVLANSLALQNSTLTYSTSGGSLTIADPVAALTLGGLGGDRPFPLTNSLGTSIALTVGQSGDSTTYSGSPLGSGATLTKTRDGTLALSGSHTYTGNTLVSAGTLSIDTGSTFNTAAANLGTAATARLLVNGGTLNASASSLVTNASIGLAVAGGVANFTGGITTDTGSSSAESYINVTGGILNAASVSLSRGSLSITSEPASGQTNQGLYINGGTVNITGTLGIGAIAGSNSSVSSRMDSGSLTVDGPVTLGINNIGRWSVLDINGGSFTANDTTTGVQLGSAFDGQVIMHIRGSGAVVKTPRIQFGQGAFAGKAILGLGNGALYVGSGGMALGSSNPAFVGEVRLNGGTLGATADWSSTLPILLNGLGFVATGADETDTPHTITLHGTATGLGTLTKNGSGTVLFTSPSNDYFGPTIVNAGTLGIGGKTTDLLTVNVGASFAPQGVFNAESGVTLDGTLSIGYNSAAPTPVSRLESTLGSVTLGASSTLVLSGTGFLTAPAYVLVKSSAPITGTFASVSGIPAGYTLDYAYDDDSDVGTPPVIAITGGGVNPYDAWTASYSLAGPDALPSADPDSDGLVNLLEYALDTSPVASDADDAYTLGRSGNFLTLSFDHPADATLTYTIEASTDLAAGWGPVHTFAPFTTSGPETYTDTADLTVTPRRFLRLKVTPAP